MSTTARLSHEVDLFVAGLTPALEALARGAGMDPSRAGADVALDAYHLAAALVAADGRVGDHEILALISVFAGRLDGHLVQATPAEVRRQGLLDDAAEWLGAPSPLFSLLRDADLGDGSTRARQYYERAMAVAHATVALDGYTDRLELSAVEEFRKMLLRLLPPAPAQRTGPAPAEPAPAGARPVGTVEGLHEPERSLEELLAALDELVGLDGVKAEVRLVTDLLRVEQLRRDRDLPVAVQSRHLVFTGNPGTGKTTVARLVAQIYRALGVVERGHLVETDRSGLVAGFVGQTATRVTEVFDAADGGVLLIDEAYALARGGERDFGAEAIDTLVKLMEDRRDRVVVIVAGYTDEMATFIDANPGLRSRFPKTIFFPDYTTDELLAILELLARRHHYRLTRGARDAMRSLLERAPRDRGFGNGRLARNLFEAAVARQASRVVARVDALHREGREHTEEDLVTLTARDVPERVDPHATAEG